MKLLLAPIEFDAAAAFVRKHHRHHTPPVGHKFSLAAWFDDGLIGRPVGVVIVGRPVSRERQDGFTLEITRLCTPDDLPTVTCRDGKERKLSVASFLYNSAARATFALGYRRIGTYTLKREDGHSLVQAGWRVIAEVKGRSWSTPSRPRTDKHPTEDKLLWEPGWAA